MTSVEVRFRHSPHIPGLELANARYRGRAFPPHLHEEYVIGAMTAGAEKLSIRGREHIVRQGHLILIEPGEPHANCAVNEEPFGYAVMYVPIPVMASLVHEALDGRANRQVRFADAVPCMPSVHRALLRTHAVLMGGESRLDEESALVHFLSALLRSGHMIRSGPPAAVGQQTVRCAQDYIETYFRESISLRQLSDLTGASAFHLLRSFKKHVGLPPAAYQIQLRITEAKRMLRAGEAIAETAAELGFADQSHLTRHFHRIVGTTPGQYAAQ